MSSSTRSMPESSSQHSPHGIHIAMECGGCRRELLEDQDQLKRTMVWCAEEAGATVVDSLIHSYNPAGLSGVVIIAESHIAIHTWPGIGYASFDIYTCGKRDLAEGIADRLEEEFSPEEVFRTILERSPPVSPR